MSEILISTTALAERLKNKRTGKRPHPATVARWARLLGVRDRKKGEDRGRPFVWNETSLRELYVLSWLRDHGMSILRQRVLIASLRAAGLNPFSSGIFAVMENDKVVDVVREIAPGKFASASTGFSTVDLIWNEETLDHPSVVRLSDVIAEEDVIEAE